MRSKAIIAILAFSCVVIAILTSSLQIKEAQSVSSFRIAIGTIEIQDLDTNSEKVQLRVIFEEKTGSDSFKDRSMNWIMFPYGIRNSSFIYNAIPVGPADPDWKLIGNSSTTWSWRLEKTLDVSYQRDGFAFPFESFNVRLYVSSNDTRGFEIRSDILNIDSSIVPMKINPEELPSNFNFADTLEDSILDISLSPNFISSFIASMVYALFAILVLIAFVLFYRILFKGINKNETSNSITVTSSVLVFLPILVFTFRTSIAPKYLTPVDWAGFALTLVYGVLLVFEVTLRNRRKIRINYDHAIE